MLQSRPLRVLLAVTACCATLGSQAAGPEPVRPPPPLQQALPPLPPLPPLPQAMMGQLQADLGPIHAATRELDQCGRMAHYLGQLQPPRGHVEARKAEIHNQAVAKRDPAFANLPMIRHEPSHEGFMRAMQKGKVDLENCARQLGPALKGMPVHLKRLYDGIDTAEKPGGMPKDVARHLHRAIVQYHEAHERFADAVVSLSKDQDVQAYLHEAIVKLIEATNVAGEPGKK